MAGAHVEPRSVPLAASGETREALGRKAPADAMEALLGAAVLAGEDSHSHHQNSGR